MSEQQTPVVNAVKSRTSQDRKYFQKGAQRQHGVSQHPKCGRYSHRKPIEYPAKGKICHNCGKRNHFAACCRGKRQTFSAVENFPSRENSKSGETGSPVTYLLGSVEENKTKQKKNKQTKKKTPKNPKKKEKQTNKQTTTQKKKKKILIHFLHD